jgi:hypothetical protein
LCVAVIVVVVVVVVGVGGGGGGGGGAPVVTLRNILPDIVSQMTGTPALPRNKLCVLLTTPCATF